MKPRNKNKSKFKGISPQERFPKEHYHWSNYDSLYHFLYHYHHHDIRYAGKVPCYNEWLFGEYYMGKGTYCDKETWKKLTNKLHDYLEQIMTEEIESLQNQSKLIKYDIPSNRLIERIEVS